MIVIYATYVAALKIVIKHIQSNVEVIPIGIKEQREGSHFLYHVKLMFTSVLRLHNLINCFQDLLPRSPNKGKEKQREPRSLQW